MNRDGAALRARADDLLARVAIDSSDAGARRAAAEALLRLAIVDGEADAGELLRRAVELDPYRGELWLLLAHRDRDAGNHALAEQRLELAALVMPGDRRVAVLRAELLRVRAVATRAPELGDRAVAELAPQLERAPDDQPLIAAMLEALLCGAPDALAARAPALLARVRPGHGVERLAYVIAAVADDAAVLDAVVALARRCAPPGMPEALAGVVAVVEAKRLAAEQLCERIDTVAAAIADARIVRLVLRERLATIVEPQRRLELLERAMARAPGVEGLAHDHLQLLHLVAKRAVASGDAAAARASWRACLARDRDNLGALENLARLAAATGEAAPELASQIAALRAVYAAYSPRAELVLLRAGAELVGGVARAAAAPVAAADVARLVAALARGLALCRLARDGGARAVVSAAAIAALLDGSAAFDDAVAVLAQPLLAAPPLAYALVGVAKDASHDDVAAGYADAFGRAPDDAWRAKLARDAEALLDPATRAAYDARTAGVELGELLRVHARLVLAMLAAVTRATSADAVHADTVAMLRKLVPAPVQPYVLAEQRTTDDRQLEGAFQQAVFGAVLDAATADFAAGRVAAGLDRLAAHADAASGLSRYHDLLALHAALDPRVPVDAAAARARQHARRSVELWGNAHPDATVAAMASEDDAAFAERVAIRRARALLELGESRGALDALWWAHPDTDGKMQLANLPVLQWANVARAGSLDYRLATAAAMRAATHAWYGHQDRPTSWATYDARRAALVALRTASWWAQSARDAAVGNDAAIASRLAELLDADRKQLTS